MLILVINAGSSSIKYQLLNMETKTAVARGTAERIGIKGGRITHNFLRDGKLEKVEIEREFPSHI
jgi:acetate kinase